MKKLNRIFCGARELFLTAFFSPVAFVCKKVNKNYKNLWLVGERGNDARDNGYWFYKYLKENHTEINSRYVITRGSADYEKIQKLGGAVEYRGFKHYLSYFCAVNLIGTHIQPCAPDKIMYYHFAQKGIRARGKQTFLKHGIFINDVSWLNAKNLYIDLLVCGAKPEYDYVKAYSGHREGVVRYLGLCRFDNLIRQSKKEKMILVMPTWRGASYPSGEAFPQTEYAKKFNSLLNNHKLGAMLEKFGYTLVFYPHVEMQKNIKYFSTKSDRVIIGDKSKFDVQQLLMDCAVLVTDYSSVFFDVAFLKKPVLYYQFDAEEFPKVHYKKGYFDFERDGFGPVCANTDELVDEIEKCFENNMQMNEKYLCRTERFFEMRDDKNCERIFNAICNLA